MSNDTTDSSKKEMSFLGHLEELRWRLFRSAIVVLVFAIVIFIFRKDLMEWVYMAMSKPDFITYQWFCWIDNAIGLDGELCATEIDFQPISTSMTAQFSATMYFAIVGGIVCAFPYIAWQIWGFVKPALTATETKVSTKFFPYSIILFILGLAFGYLIISPLTVQFFANWRIHEGVANLPTISSYMSIITTTTFFTALLFQLPIISYLLSRLGIINPQFLRKFRKHSIVVILILSAIITPPDLFSQIIVGIPIMLLYEISIKVSARAVKQNSK